MRNLAAGLALWLMLGLGAAWTAPDFPPLTGRVVDGADLLGSLAKRQLTEQLAAHEAATTNQVVVVTLASLQGRTIEEFGYRLGRHWGIGQKGRDNGVLLIVAPAERKVRIEVGYGLEGSLTDAAASAIIQQEILPRFREDNYEAGIDNGVTAILGTIAGTYQPRDDPGHLVLGVVAFGALLLIVMLLVRQKQRRDRRRRAGVTVRSRARQAGDGAAAGIGGAAVGIGGVGGADGGGGGFGGGGASGGW